MGHNIDRRQKPIWQKRRRPMPPPSKSHSSKKGGPGINRKEKSWKEQSEEQSPHS